MKVAALICVVLTTYAYGRMVYKEDLPKGLLPESKIAELEEGLKNGSITLDKEDVARFLEQDRKRRAINGVSEAWCCREVRPLASLQKPMLITIQVEKTLNAGGSIKCGFAGWKRCSSDKQTKVTVIEYRQDYNWISIPSQEWNGGCPEEKVVCCDGYVFRPVSDNCLTGQEYSDMVDLQMKYCHFDLGILEKFAPLSTDLPCPRFD